MSIPSGRSKVDSQIFVYGPPGSGKSTVGRLLARDLGLPFWDLDQEIEAKTGKGIPQIFEQEGEAVFRAREKALLEDVIARGQGVISLGGGALLDPLQRARVENAGQVLCLNAPLDGLLERLQTSQAKRPLLDGDLQGRLRSLVERRSEHYASFPLQIDTQALTPEEISWQAQISLGIWRLQGMGSSYDAIVRARGLEDLGGAMQRRGLRGPLALVCDENTGKLYGPGVINSLQAAGYSVQCIAIPSGEAHKTMQTVMDLWAGFLQAGLERSSTVIALGGGVVGDLAGFAAATFLRGVPWAVLPTTLLSMVDSSLGGKTGADLPQGKNLVGAFHPPRLVLVDPDCLSTLPKAELRSGMAEVVKHGVIGDPFLFERCAQGWEALESSWDEVVRRAMAVKIRVIEADPYERGIRAALNLGHTIGHAVELTSGFRLRHGEAVAIGMAIEARISEKLGLAEVGLVDTIEAALKVLGLPTRIPPDLDREAILQATGVDKKRSGGKVRFALPVRIGEVKVGVVVDGLEMLVDF